MYYFDGTHHTDKIGALLICCSFPNQIFLFLYIKTDNNFLASEKSTQIYFFTDADLFDGIEANDQYTEGATSL